MRFSIVCPISRDFQLVLQNLAHIIQPPHSYELIFGIDNRKLSVKPLTDGISLLDHHDLIEGVEVVTSEMVKTREGDVRGRRERIAAMHNLMSERVSGEWVFGFEDDSIFDKSPIPPLLDTFLTNSKRYVKEIGFVEGVQVGRWGEPYVGGWKITPEKYESIDLGTGVEEIDAGGLYCFLTPAELYKDHTFKATEVGPDINYGLYLRAQDYTNLINFHVVVGHRTEKKDLYPDKVAKVSLIKQGNRWVQQVEKE